MPVIEVTLAEGRPPEKLSSLIRALTDAVEQTGVGPRDSVRVILREVPPTHFAAGGVTLAERAAASAATTDTTADQANEEKP